MKELLDKNTFGATRASEIIVAIINEMGDEKIAKKVSKLFTQYSNGIHEIYSGLKNKKILNVVMAMWKERCESKIGRSGLPDKIQSYLVNMEIALCRRIRKGEFDYCDETNETT